jgi:transglutaminase-like putative cysteine protease
VERVNGWRLQVRHATTSRYAGQVFASYNEVRLTPLSNRSQTTISDRIDVHPAARLFRHVDYWGTIVHSFDVHTPHEEFTVTGISTVETSVRDHANAASWDDLATAEIRDSLYEYLVPSRFVDPPDDLTAVANEVRGGARTPADATRSAIESVHDQFVYERGYTNASTSAAEAWTRKRGVCQDFAHVTLALLRRMGIPARYVSGYLHPDTDATIGETVKGQSHAWIDAWLGDWVPFDPTNGQPVRERHVAVARARDYGDVSPLRGVYTGAAATDQDVSVEITRVA